MFIIFLRVIHLKTLIRIAYIVIIPYLSKNYLFIYYLFIIYLFVYFIYLFIYLFYYFIYLFKYIVYRKEQSKIGGKSTGKTGREYDQISQTIKKKCYL